MEPTQEVDTQIPTTIPGVRVLFKNTQTFDLPLVSAIDELAPEFSEVVARFASEAWLTFHNAGVSFQTSTVLAVVKIEIPVTSPETEVNVAQSSESPAEAVLPVG